MRSPIYGWTSSAPSTSVANYNMPKAAGGASWGTAAAGRAMVVPHDMTIDTLRATVTTAPGAGKTRAVTLFVNGVASTLTCTIADTATQAQDLTHRVSVLAGDLLTIQFTPTGTPTASGACFWNMVQDAPTYFGVLGGVTTGPTAAATQYMAPYGRVALASTDALASVPIPTSGVLRNLRFSSGAAPGASTSWQLTVFKNGVATAITCTISGASATTASDLVNTVTVAAGDLVSIQVITTGAPVGTNLAYSMSFDPDVDGESFTTYSDWAGVQPSTSATRFQSPNESGDSFNATETSVFARLPASVVTALYCNTSVSPGVSPKAYAFTLRNEIASTSAVVTVNDASTAVGSGRASNITGQSIAIAADNRVDMQVVPTGTPIGLFSKWGILHTVSSTAPVVATPSLVFPSRSRRNTMIKM